MGFLNVDFQPLQITPITPPGKSHLIKVFQVPRSQTVTQVMVELPAQSSITNIWQYGGVASDAATTATVALTVTTGGTTISTGTANVKTNGATTNVVNMTGLPNVQPTPLVGDLSISAVYAETGTASTTGGPWNFAVEYVA